MIVKMKDVIKRYGDEVMALDYLNLEIKKGDVVGLLGPNGAGKTTAINIISGLLELDEGEIFVFGEKQTPKNKNVKKKIGLVTQEVTVYEDLSAYENLRFFGSLYGLKGKPLEDKIHEVAELVGITEKLHVIPKKYSGGMKRRLNIGCALLHDPELVILDEPTVGIDPQSRNYILEFIKKLAKEKNTSMIYTSHYIEEVEQISDFVYIIDQGHIIAKGTVKDLISKMKGDQIIDIEVRYPKEETVKSIKALPDVKDVYLEHQTYKIMIETSVNMLDQILQIVAKETVLHIKHNEPNLEDVFLMLTGKHLRDGGVLYD